MPVSFVRFVAACGGVVCVNAYSVDFVEAVAYQGRQSDERSDETTRIVLRCARQLLVVGEVSDVARTLELAVSVARALDIERVIARAARQQADADYRDHLGGADEIPGGK